MGIARKHGLGLPWERSLSLSMAKLFGDRSRKGMGHKVPRNERGRHLASPVSVSANWMAVFR